MQSKITFYLSLILVFFSACKSSSKEKAAEGQPKPRVFITTDIQLCCGDPDDVQSLVHVLWYADELDIVGIVPEKLDRDEKPGGIPAAERVLAKYEADYNHPDYNFKKMGFPEPTYLMNEVLLTDSVSAINKLIEEAKKLDGGPLYVLAWGNLKIINGALIKDPSIVQNIRLLTIGTNVRAPSAGGDGYLVNWNSYDRQGVDRKMMVENPALDSMWWIENDWGYAGMFVGIERDSAGMITGGKPYEIMVELTQKGGALGRYLQEVVSGDNHKWANYFRVGDTPSVLYLIDPDNDMDDPTKGSWAGRFVQPFPEERPNYWTNEVGDVEWDYANPANTWHNADTVEKISYQYLLQVRDEMYEDLMQKVAEIYNSGI